MNQPQMGDRVREIVTDREGVVTGQSEFLWGCRQCLVHYRDEDGKSQSEWYDVGRLSVLERSVVEAIDYFTEAAVAEPAERAAHRGSETPPATR
jgi:hypothetical protein